MRVNLGRECFNAAAVTHLAGARRSYLFNLVHFHLSCGLDYDKMKGNILRFQNVRVQVSDSECEI
jgi:hypothetical protein